MIEELITCDESRIPVVWFVTHEEARAEAAITMYAKALGGDTWIWSLTSNNGFPGWEQPTGMPEKSCPFNEELSSSPEGAVLTVIGYAQALEEKIESEEVSNSKIIAIFRDPHAFLDENLSFVRELRDATRELKDTEALIVCLSPRDKIPEELRKDVEVIHPGLPSKNALQNVLSQLVEEIGISDFTNMNGLAEACVGLTLNQAADALSKSFTKYRKIDLEYIGKIKTAAISSVPGLTYIGEAPTMDEVGGLDGLKEWLEERKEGFSPKAREANLPIPRGILCVGVTGCGKSLLAKAVSSYFGMPLVCLNPPDIKGGIVGETEGNMRMVREAIESLGQCVVWIDEFEKGLPKAGDRNLDGGTSDALLQGLLNWMQERKGGAFIVATANDISALPPELLRKGRWDSIFFVDLPTYEERIEIFNIHLNRRSWVLPEEDIKTLARETENYSGAEIEATVIDGRWRAYNRGEELTSDDILACVKVDVPLFQTMEEQIKSLRDWAKTRARPASTVEGRAIIKNRSRKPGTRKISLKTMEKADG